MVYQQTVTPTHFVGREWLELFLSSLNRLTYCLKGMYTGYGRVSIIGVASQVEPRVRESVSISLPGFRRYKEIDIVNEPCFKGGKRRPVAITEQKIERYLRDLPPGVLNFRSIDSIEILGMRPGTYNLNFHIKINQREFIFRVNIEQQSGLPNQIEYEFIVLKFLENHRVAPKAYHFDNTRDHFEFGLLVEDYLEGPHASLQKREIPDLAELLTRLHSLKPGNMPFIAWRRPLIRTYQLARNDLTDYERKGTSEKGTIGLAKEVLNRAEALLRDYEELFDGDSLNHTDVVCDNFIKTPEGLRLIDWEKPRVDDCSYDIACLFSEPAQLWFSQNILTPENRKGFLETYASLAGKRADLLLEKVRVREPLVSLHWVLWGASKLCDLKEGRTKPELMRAHEEKVARYERVARPENIEKLLDSI